MQILAGVTALERSTLRVRAFDCQDAASEARFVDGQRTSVSLSPSAMRSASQAVVYRDGMRSWHSMQPRAHKRARHHREPGPLLIDNAIVIAHSVGMDAAEVPLDSVVMAECWPRVGGGARQTLRELWSIGCGEFLLILSRGEVRKKMSVQDQ
jgi:hypothetical protein